MNIRPVVSVSLALLLAAPLAAQQESVCSARDDAPGDASFGTYFDSAAVARMLEREWNPDWGALVGELQPSPAAPAGTLRLYSTASDEPEFARVVEWLLTLRTLAPMESAEAIPVVLAEGEEIRPRAVVALAGCEPQLVNREVIERRLREATEDDPALLNAMGLPTGERTDAVLDVLVGTDGQVLEHRVVRAPEVQNREQLLNRNVQLLRFEPGTIEGIVVPMRTRISLALTPRD